MTLLSEAIKEKILDVRMLTRNLFKGVIVQEDIDKQQKTLPDDGANAEYTNVDLILEDVRSSKH